MNKGDRDREDERQGDEIVGDHIWTSAYGKAVDQLSAERFGMPLGVLMEHAGRGVAEALLDAAHDGSPVVVLAGPGNNGGDALVAARWLSEAGLPVSTYTISKGKDQEPSPLFQEQLARLKAFGYTAEAYSPGALKRFGRRQPVIIDGVFGTGFKGPLDRASLAFRALSEADALPERLVLAVDIPSGLDADSGEEQDVPLRADLTVTFGGKKAAQVLSPARDACGEVLCLDIGMPLAALKAAPTTGDAKPWLMLPDTKELLAEDPWEDLPRHANKYDRGHVLVIGGSVGKTGAPLMAGMAAMRAGAGWVTIAMPNDAYQSLKGDVPREMVFEALFEGNALSPLKLERFIKERKVRAIVVGCGMLDSPLTDDIMAVLASVTGGGAVNLVVVDAGATKNLAKKAAGQQLAPEHWLATPHPGEWRHLGLSSDKAPLTGPAFHLAAAQVESMGIAVLFKSATPILIPGIPDALGSVVTDGTAILARAGSGDVLAGVIGAHGAIGLSSAVSALRGQAQVAWAARLAAETQGENGVLARDIMDCLGKAAAAALKAAEVEDDDGDEDDPSAKKGKGRRDGEDDGEEEDTDDYA